MEPSLVTRPRPRPIAAVMRAAGITNNALAVVVGCSPTYLSMVVNGHRPGSRRLRAALSLALGVPVQELF